MLPRTAILPVTLCVALFTTEAAHGATYTVCPSSTGVTCDYTTLADAVALVPSGDTIELLYGAIYHEQVVVSGKDLIIASDLATGASTIAPTTGRAVTASNATVVLQDVLVSGGYGGSGLRVYGDGDITMLNGALYSCTAVEQGPGARVDAGGTLTLDNVNIAENAVYGLSGPPAHDGGAIYAGAGATVSVSGNKIQDCSASRGGAIRLEGATLYLDSVEFTNNAAAFGAPNIYATDGATIDDTGSVFFDGSGAGMPGAGIHALDSDVFLSETTLMNLYAAPGGGAIYWSDDEGHELELDSVSLTANTSSAPGGAVYWWGEHTDSVLEVQGSSFPTNTSSMMGGAIYAGSSGLGTVILHGNGFYANYNTSKGGAVYIHNVDTVQSSDNFFGYQSNSAEGGALYLTMVATASLVDDWFEDNHTTEGGGAATAEDVGSLTLDGVTFEMNSAGYHGGALRAVQVDALEIADSTFDFNIATQSGGAVYAEDVGSIALTDSWFEDNSASWSGGGLFAAEVPVLTAHRNVFLSGYADDAGSAMSLASVGTSTITNNAVLNSSAFDYTAALRVADGTSTEIANNVFLATTTCSAYGVVDIFDTSLEAVNNVIWHGVQGDIGKVDKFAAACPTNVGLYARWSTTGFTHVIDHNLTWGDGDHVDAEDSDGPIDIGENNLTDIEPDFQDYTLGDGWDEANLWPIAGGNLIDAGDPTRLDPDGTISDIGLYGGEGSWTQPFDDEDVDGWLYMFDCVDRDPAIYPDAPELCDGHDNDCDGVVDDGVDDDADEDGYSACDGDCAPLDGDTYPGAAELCDGRITDCDLSALPVVEVDVDGDGYVACDLDGSAWVGITGGGDCDEGDDDLNPATVWYDDDDGDGYGDSADSLAQCAQPAGHVRDDTDCNDDSAAEHPGAVWYLDDDGDGFGDDEADQEACEQPDDHVADDTDCDDSEVTVYPGAPELCDGLANDCGDSLRDDEIDDDEDGHVECDYDVVVWNGDPDVVGGLDCDDDAGTVYPGAASVCDGIVNDCDADGLDDDEVDHDGDGYVECKYKRRDWEGDDAVVGGDDCAPLDDTVHPEATELCDGLINDCDDDVLPADEADGDSDGVVACTFDEDGWDGDADVWGDQDCEDDDATVFPGAPALCDGQINDCDADALPADETDDDADGYVECSLVGAAWSGITGGGDCDDEVKAIYPGAAAICDGLVNDCAADGLTTDELDLDGDGHVVCAYDSETWAGDDGVTGGLDCSPLDVTVYPGATELCDGQINDCNTGSLPTDESDDDDDGVVECALDGGGWDGAIGVWAGGDCDDDAITVFPGAPELCDGLMNDCDGSEVPTDETDDDVDGYVECDLDVDAWTGITGGGDCDDDAVGVNPGATEVCDASDVDEDCDGLADDADASVTGGTDHYLDFDGDGYGNEDATAVSWCDPPAGWVTDNTDCDDLDDGAYPGATEEAYDFVDQDCDGEDLCDVDEDGYDSDQCLGDDCDDADAAVHPDADDAWYDGVDSDCDGADDYDQDGDGYSSEDHGGEDCDDTDPTTFPGAADEPKDDIDQDCDGEDAKGGCSSVPVAPSGILALIGLLGATVRRRR